MFDFVNSSFELMEAIVGEIDYIYNHTDKIDHDFETIKGLIDTLADQLGTMTTLLYVILAVGVVILALQVVILVKLSKKSNDAASNMRQLPGPEKGKEEAKNGDYAQ